MNSNNHDIDVIDLLGYISAPIIDSEKIKIELREFFTIQELRIPAAVINELVNKIEEIVDDNHNNIIKNFVYYLKEKHNIIFIREHTDEIIISDQDTNEIDNFE